MKKDLGLLFSQYKEDCIS